MEMAIALVERWGEGQPEVIRRVGGEKPAFEDKIIFSDMGLGLVEGWAVAGGITRVSFG